MFIHRREDRVVDIYPFIDDERDAPFASVITANTDGRVVWRGEVWTQEKATWYAGCILAAFNEAFKITRQEPQNPTE